MTSTDTALSYGPEEEEEGGGITPEGQALGHRYVMGNVNAYCPKCSDEHGVCVLDCDYDLDRGRNERTTLMADETYNGWKNYETWVVGMFLDGNYDGPGTYYGTIETVRQQLEDIEHPTSEYWTVDESRRFTVADALKDYVEELCNPHMVDDDHPVQLTGLVADLFGAALSEVDWHELADAWIENMREQTTA